METCTKSKTKRTPFTLRKRKKSFKFNFYPLPQQKLIYFFSLQQSCNVGKNAFDFLLA
jgi:hypothetical protein